MNEEELIYEMYKEKPLRSAKGFKREIKNKFKDVNAGEIYVRITNYQIARYGEKLDPRAEKITLEEKKYIAHKARYRKYYRTKRRDIND